MLIETTGLAQPAPIIQTFFLDPKVADRMRLDGVVTMVGPGGGRGAAAAA